ncbi:MAG: arginase [Rhizobiaceae bacterium]
MKIIEIFGAPFDLGASTRGASMGPTALRVAGLTERLSALGHPVIDNGDLTMTPVEALHLEGRTHDEDRVAGWARALEQAAIGSLEAGNIPVFLGGDHSISFGTVAGASRHAQAQGKPLFVLWLDAHADYNTPKSSPSGNMHGMPVAFFTGLPGFDGLLDTKLMPVAPENVFLFGVRSIDADERRLLLSAGVNVLDMRALDEHGVGGLMRRIVDVVKKAGGMLHVSLDADFLDPSIAPGVGTPVNGGATWREAHLALEMLADSGLVTSLDIVELNPFLDERGKTAKTLVELTASLFGQRIYETVDAAAFVAGTGGHAKAEMLLSV